MSLEKREWLSGELVELYVNGLLEDRWIINEQLRDEVFVS
jgi:hypothetical protein